MSTSPLLGPDVAEYDTNLESAANEYYESLNEEAVDDDEDGDDDADDDDVILLREERLKHQDIHWFRRPSWIMVGLIVFLFAFALSVSAATHKVLEVKLTCNYLAANSKDGLCDPGEIQLVISNLQMAYNILGNIVMLVASGKVSALSDRYGRKIFIVGVISTILLGRLTRYFTVIKWDTLHFGMMVFSEVTAYLGGGPLSLVALLNCYVADVVDPQHRIYYLSVSISAAMLLGSFIGPLVGNLLLSVSDKINNANPGNLHLLQDGPVHGSMFDVTKSIHPSDFIPVKFEVGILVFLWLFVLFVLPESRSKKQRRKSRSFSVAASSATIIIDSQQSFYSRFLQSVNFLQPLKLLIIPDEYLTSVPHSRRNKLRLGVLILILVDTLLTAFKLVLGEITLLYGIYQFNWSQSEIGYLIAISCIASAFALIVFLPFLNNYVLQKLFKFKVLKRLFDMVDYWLTIVGSISDVLGLFLIYFAGTTIQLLGTIVVSCVGVILAPTLNSAIVKFYPESKIGELYGALALTKNLFGLVTPVIFLSLYKFFISQWNKPQLIFMVFSLLLSILLVGVVVAKAILGLDESTGPSITRSNSTVTFGDLISESHPQPSKKSGHVRVDQEDIQA